jgi:hypothetical protein
MRTATFFSDARLDGLARREERVGVKLSETFMGREDRMLYRCVGSRHQ